VRSQSSFLPWLVPGLLLLFLTLRPVPALDIWVDRALAPVRRVGELAAPLVMLQRAGSSAREARQLGQVPRESEASAALLASLARSALPTEVGLLAGRRVVHGAVIGRVEGHRDLLLVELRDLRGVDVGFPVACGNAYVGRVKSLRRERSLAVVELVTGADFHVGGEVRLPEWEDGRPDATPVLMTVGGIFEPRGAGDQGAAEINLVVENPSDRAVRGGLVRVDERYGETPLIQRLSLGLHLGRLTRGNSTWGIIPELDYQDGIFQVVVLCPEDERLGSDLPFESASQDDGWLQVRPIGLGDPSPYRHTARVRVGQNDGLQRGAARLHHEGATLPAFALE